MSTARTLWHGSADLAEAARQHPFLRRLADGTLERERFAGYIAQDAYFLESFALAYAAAVRNCPDESGAEAFAALLAGVREELRLHASYARRWGVDLAHVEPGPATLAYTGFLEATAATDDVGLICAAMTPCMRLYAYLGQSLAGTRTSDTYAEWLHTYADPRFEALAARLEQLLETYCDDPDRASVTYRRAMRLELDFFDAADQGPVGKAATGAQRPTCYQVSTTTSSRDVAQALARTAVESRVAACGQLVGPISSVYRWQETIETADEWLVLFKTAADRVDALIDHLRSHHPYDVPEVIATPITGGHPEYLSWVVEETRPR